MNKQTRKTVEIMAVKDINDYHKPILKEQQEKYHGDNYIITSQYLQTKETRRLNRELGISNINKKRI